VPTKKRILWLHTQPEFYHNRMLDDLATGDGYRVPGMENEHPEEFEWIAGFVHRGTGHLSEHALPAKAQTVFLRALPGKENRPPSFREHYHVNWREDLKKLGNSPLGPDAIIVSGYFLRTFREIFADGTRLGVPTAIFSDSNLRGEHGRGLKLRAKRCLKRLLLQKLVQRLDGILTANRLGVAYWRYYCGTAGQRKTVVCPYYTDYRRIDIARHLDRQTVLQKFGLHVDDRILFSSARLAPVKGLDLMIRAFNALGMAQRGWKYVIAGTGPLENDLKSLAGPHLDQSIRFLGFQQPSDNLALMAHADIMVLPSRYEPHGIVVSEAQAAGTPVLLSHVVGAAAGLVHQGESGLLFRSDDLGDLQSKLELLEQPGVLASLRAASRPAFEKWYRRTSPMLVTPRIVRRMLAGGTP